MYRPYIFDNDVFGIDLEHKLTNCENYSEYESGFLVDFTAHAQLKKKIVQANEVPYMTENLRKAISNKSRLENRYYRDKSIESLRASKKQKNICSRLYKRERKRYYSNLDLTKITDSKKFWKTAKPFLSDKGAGTNGITLIEEDEIFHEESEVANILNDFLVTRLQILMYPYQVNTRMRNLQFQMTQLII